MSRAEGVCTDCPEWADLEQWVRNELPPDESWQFETHLSSCAHCRARVEEVRANLELVAPIRGLFVHSGLPMQLPEEIGGYRLIRKIGEGGMGVVFEARQRDPDRAVALKIIRPERLSSLSIRRFRYEMHLLGRLHHPAIAQIFEGGTHQVPGGSLPFFTMELVEGLPLLEYARTRNHGLRSRLELIARICDAVQHAHDNGVIHRDLKPGNILVSDHGGEAHPMILDFGVARAIGADPQPTTLQTHAGQLLGTIAYMSPEQVSGRSDEIDARSDVYAMGVICYELLAGRLPYDSPDAALSALIWQIGHDDPAPLSALDRTFRGDVETIVAKALQKERQRRYASASEMAADIRRFLRHEPIEARPPSTMYQLRKFARRNRGLVGGIAVAFMVLVLGIVGTGAGMLQARSSLVTAREQREAAQLQEALARRNLERATLEASKALAINEFLQEMLVNADPVHSLEREMLVRDALDQAAQRLDAGMLADQPEVEAAVRTTLGGAYRSLARFDEAHAQLARALEIRRSLFGEIHIDVARTVYAIGCVHLRQHDYATAERLLRQSLEMGQALEPGDSLHCASAMVQLASASQALGNYGEAEALYPGAIEMMRRVGSAADVAEVLANWAVLHHLRRDYDKAEPLLRQSLDLLTEALGESHPRRVQALNNLASLLREQKRLAEAEPLFRQSLEARRRVYDEDHPAVLRALNNLGLVLLELGRHEEAEPMIREALELRRKLYGPVHIEVAISLNNLALLMEATDRPEAAEEMMRQSLEVRQQLLPAAHPQVLSAMTNLARLMRLRGDNDGSQAMLRQVLEIQSQHLSADHPDIAVTLNSLSLAIANGGGDLAEAEALSRRALDIRISRQGSDHLTTAVVRANLASILRKGQRFEEAERELLPAYDVFRAQMGDAHPNTQKILRQLISFYEKWGKPDDAARFRTLLADAASATEAETPGQE